jgi:hypothetical protein
MGHWFDDLAKALERKQSRRGALKLFAVGVGGVLAARLPGGQARGQSAGLSYPAGWNLIGGPDGSTVSGVLGSLYTLQAGDTAYQVIDPASPLTACWGYWAYFPNGGSLTPGTSESACADDGTGGNWVMIGNPSMSGPATVRGADTIYTYSPTDGYQAARTIPIGAGAWAIGNGSISLSAPVVPTIPTPVPVPPTVVPARVQPAPVQPAPVQPAPGSACCRTCTTGCPCGASCISCRDRCRVGPGCAC